MQTWRPVHEVMYYYGNGYVQEKAKVVGGDGGGGCP